MVETSVMKELKNFFGQSFEKNNSPSLSLPPSSPKFICLVEKISLVGAQISLILTQIFLEGHVIMTEIE